MSSDSNPNNARLETLIDLLLDDSLDSSQRRELDAMIADDDRAAAMLVEAMDLHAMLQWEHGQIEHESEEDANQRAMLNDIFDQALEQRRLHEIEDTAQSQLLADLKAQKKEADFDRRRAAIQQKIDDRPATVYIIPKIAAGLTMAAAIGLVAWVGYAYFNPPATSQTASDDLDPPTHIEQPPAPRVYVARVDDSYDAQWEGFDPADGRLELDKRVVLLTGIAEITFEDGATVLIEAPATFKPTGPNAMRFMEGRLAAEVPESAHGFKVVTPHMTLTDLGTEFGVEVDPVTGSIADVFVGRVIADNTTGDGEAVDLVAGSATQADTAGQLSKVFQADSTQYYREIETYTSAPQLSGRGFYLLSRPTDLSFQTYESPDGIAVLLERQSLVWQRGWRVNESFDAGPIAGKKIDVFLAHLDPMGEEPVSASNQNRFTYEVTLRFERPVLGVITKSWLLYETDASLGHPEIVYPAPDTEHAVGRGVERQADRYWLSDDGKTLHLRLRTGPRIDQVRILVEAAH